MLPNRINLILAAALIAGCKGDRAATRADSVGLPVEAAGPTAPQNSYAALAGDTLQLVSIGGTALQQSSGAPAPCDVAHTPLRQQIVIAADSTYWETTIARPGCRDSVSSSSDTVESRGGFRIFGDTLLLNPASIDDDTPFAGLLYTDSVVQVDAPAAEISRYSRHSGASGDPAQMGRIRTDTLFLSADIDGSGKSDYVVREWRMGSISRMKDYRLAVYLDKDPGSGPPNWANNWDALEVGADQSVDTSLSVAPGVTLLAMGWSGGDYSATEVLIAERGKVRPEISHGIDYGNGYFRITREAGTVVVEASLDNLELRGTPVTSAIKCTEPNMAAIRLVYDLKAGHFAPERSRCVRQM